MNFDEIFAPEQIGEGHHDEFVDIDSETWIYYANVFNRALLPLHLLALEEHLALSHTQSSDFGLQSLLAQTRCEKARVVVDGRLGMQL